MRTRVFSPEGPGEPLQASEQNGEIAVFTCGPAGGGINDQVQQYGHGWGPVPKSLRGKGRGHLLLCCHIWEGASGKPAPFWVSGLAHGRTQSWAYHSWLKAGPRAPHKYTQDKGKL